MSSSLLPLTRTARPGRTRLGLTAAALALPLALAGCGGDDTGEGGGGDGEAKEPADLGAAYDRLLDAQTATFTLSLDDGDGNLKRLATEDETDPLNDETADTVIGGKVVVTIDPAGDATLREATQVDPAASPADQLTAVNYSVSVEADGGPVAQLRLVDGALFAAVDFDRIDGIAEGAGEEPLGPQLDGFAAQSPELAAAVEDLRAGQFLTLDLAPLLSTFEGLAGPTPTGAPVDGAQLAEDLLAAVQPHSTVTGGEEGTFDVTVKAKPALQAASQVFAELPIPGVTDAIDPAQFEALDDGDLRGTVSLQGESLSQVTLDLDSVNDVNAPDEEDVELAGSDLVLGIDDEADEVTAPGEVSDVDLNALVMSFFGAFAGTMPS